MQSSDCMQLAMAFCVRATIKLGPDTSETSIGTGTFQISGSHVHPKRDIEVLLIIGP